MALNAILGLIVVAVGIIVDGDVVVEHWGLGLEMRG